MSVPPKALALTLTGLKQIFSIYFKNRNNKEMEEDRSMFNQMEQKYQKKHKSKELMKAVVKEANRRLRQEDMAKQRGMEQ